MIIISYKDKYNKYEDLNITDFEDQIELLFTVNDQLVDGDNCVDIIANAETIRYILSIAMSELDYAPHKINMEKDDATYCLEMFDDGSLRVFLYDKYNDSLQGTSIYLYQEEVTQDIVDWINENKIEIHLSYDGKVSKYLRGIDILEDDKLLSLVKQIECLRINSVITKYNTNCLDIYKHIVRKLKRDDFRYTPNVVYSINNEDLIKDFKYKRIC